MKDYHKNILREYMTKSDDDDDDHQDPHVRILPAHYRVREKFMR